MLSRHSIPTLVLSALGETQSPCPASANSIGVGKALLHGKRHNVQALHPLMCRSLIGVLVCVAECGQSRGAPGLCFNFAREEHDETRYANGIDGRRRRRRVGGLQRPRLYPGRRSQCGAQSVQDAGQLAAAPCRAASSAGPSRSRSTIATARAFGCSTAVPRTPATRSRSSIRTASSCGASAPTCSSSRTASMSTTTAMCGRPTMGSGTARAPSSSSSAPTARC